MKDSDFSNDYLKRLVFHRVHTIGELRRAIEKYSDDVIVGSSEDLSEEVFREGLNLFEANIVFPNEDDAPSLRTLIAVQYPPFPEEILSQREFVAWRKEYEKRSDKKRTFQRWVDKLSTLALLRRRKR